MDKVVAILSDAAFTLSKQLISSAESRQLPELVKQYTAFFTSYNLLVGYAHLEKYDTKKFDVDAAREQIDVVKTALMAFSRDNRSLTPKLTALDEALTLLAPKQKTSKSSKVKKGSYERLVEAVEAKFGSFGGNRLEPVVIGAGEGSPTYKFGGEVDRYYMRIYTTYHLLIADLDDLAKKPESARKEYLSRVLKSRLRDMCSTDNPTTETKAMHELLAMSGVDYLRWLLAQINLEHYVKEQRDSLLESLRAKRLDTTVKPNITHPLARAVAASFSFMKRSDAACLDAVKRTFETLDDMEPSDLAPATKALESEVAELVKKVDKSRTFRNVREAVAYTYMPDLPEDVKLTTLNTPVKVDPAIFSDPNKLPEIREAIDQYVARLDEAHNILKPVEKYYVEMLTTMQKLHQCVNYLGKQDNITREREKLVSAFVKIAILQELWRTRSHPLPPRVVDANIKLLESLDTQLRSVYEWSGTVYDDGLDLKLVHDDLLSKY